MKKLILLFTICILISCDLLIDTNEPLIVTSIKNAQIDYTTDFSYQITINNDINLFTNKHYNIGDTLK